jgi:hypothetical protein
MAPGALPHPGRVPEQRLLSLENGLRRRRRCGTVLGETPIDLGFSLWILYIGEGAMLEGGQGPHTIGWRALGVTRATRWCGCPWLPSDSSLDSISCRGKIGTSGFVSSNSENISCVTFLKLVVSGPDSATARSERRQTPRGARIQRPRPRIQTSPACLPKPSPRTQRTSPLLLKKYTTKEKRNPRSIDTTAPPSLPRRTTAHPMPSTTPPHSRTRQLPRPARLPETPRRRRTLRRKGSASAARPHRTMNRCPGAAPRPRHLAPLLPTRLQKGRPRGRDGRSTPSPTSGEARLHNSPALHVPTSPTRSPISTNTTHSQKKRSFFLHQSAPCSAPVPHDLINLLQISATLHKRCFSGRT